MKFTEEMEKYIKRLFNEADKDKSGKIEKCEINHLLSLLGINASDDELEIYFSKFDKVIFLNFFTIFLPYFFTKHIFFIKDGDS